jgi:2-polyprenyl-3-methyl-5-hydroxy-6-metoxy-1,4-benzoquinol methylase
MTENDEFVRLEQIGRNATYAAGINSTITALAYLEAKKFVTGKVLELGPAEGVMTSEMIADGIEPELVEGSKTLAEKLSAKFPKLTIHTSLFENYESHSFFDTIIMGHVLEHVEDPIAILLKYKSFLTNNGVIWASVPNANSIHRQAAVQMGLLNNVKDLNEADVRHGHRRVFTPEEFRQVFKAAGYEILEFSGYWLKPLSNVQIEANWTPEMVVAFCKLGRNYPEIAGEMYIVARSILDSQ